MKKLYSLSILFFLAYFFSANKCQAQAVSISSFYILDSCKSVGARIMTNVRDNNVTGRIYWGDGTHSALQYSSSTYPYMNHGHIYQSPGTYTVIAKLYKNGIAIDSVRKTHRHACRYAEIITYQDLNNNCVKDANEKKLYARISYAVDSAGVTVDTILTTGRLLYNVAVGTTYKFKAIKHPLGVSSTCPANNTITITAPTHGKMLTYYYGIQCNNTSQFDLSATMSGRYRPVDTSYLAVNTRNLSCSPKAGKVTLYYSHKYKVVDVYPTPTNSSTSGQFVWDNLLYESLDDRKSFYLKLVPKVGINIAIGDIVCNKVEITPIVGDSNAVNNIVNACERVRGACDPNDKTVMPSGNIQPGTKLTYTVNFENLGNDTAFNIHILDTLSQFLDVSSFELISASHPTSYIISKMNNNQNLLRFDFADIQLPDSSSKQYNKGYVIFSINVKNNLAPLIPIKNRAGIYFDINPVVLTNYAENMIAPVSVPTIAMADEVLFYPNPVTNVLTVKTGNGSYTQLKVLNSLGQVMIEQAISKGATTVNMQQLSTGIYVVQISGADGTHTYKVQKQ